MNANNIRNPATSRCEALLIRLVPGGTSLPSTLVAEQASGQVLFICGAGVSKEAGLPLFGELVERVYANLGEDWRPHLAEREGMRRGGRMQGQYDRVLRCLERRLAGSDPRTAPAIRERIQAAVRAALGPPDKASLDGHRSLLTLSTGLDGRTRIVTTNLDTSFERARNADGHPLQSHAGSSLPQPGTSAFEGVMHNHGRVRDDKLDLPETGVVLTSAEFGEAYLRSGWAARYVYDLARAYTLVLVGYAADDPPMRYMMEVLEADRSRFPDIKPVYAFAGVRPGQEKLERALWAAKGIQLLPYRIDRNGSHAALFQTLGAWADYTSDPTAWRERRLSKLLSGSPRRMSNQRLLEISELLGHGDALVLLTKLSPSANWYAQLKDRDLLDAPGAEAAWIKGRLGDEEMLEACARHCLLGDHELKLISDEVSRRSEQLGLLLAKAWRLALKAASEKNRDHLAWFSVAGRAGRGDIDAGVCAAAVEAVKPRLAVGGVSFQLRSRNAHAVDPIARLNVSYENHGDTSSSDILQIWPKSPRAELMLLRAADLALWQMLEEAEEADYLKGFDRSSLGVSFDFMHTAYPIELGFSSLARLIAGLFSRIAQTNPAETQTFAAAWSTSPYELHSRLHLNALLEPVFDAPHVAEAIATLDDRLFWAGESGRETARLLLERWSGFPVEGRQRIEDRLIAGMPRSLLRNPMIGEAEWTVIVDHTTFQHLEALRSSALELRPEALARLDRIVAAHPDWRLVSPDDLSAKFLASDLVADLGDAFDGELVRDALLKGEAAPRIQEWLSLCEADPLRALRAAQLEAGSDLWRANVLGPIIYAAATTATNSVDLQAGVSALLTKAPAGKLAELGEPASAWLLKRAEQAGSGQPAAEFDAAWDAVADAVFAETTETRVKLTQPDLDNAYNSSGGRLAWALLVRLSAAKPASRAGLGALRVKFDRLMSAQGMNGLRGRMLLCRHLSYMYQVDPEWVKASLIPLLVQRNQRSGMLWNATLADGSSWQTSLFDLLKPSLIALCRSRTTNRREAQMLVARLMNALSFVPQQDEPGCDITVAETKATLAASPPMIRHEAAVWFQRRMRGEKDEMFDPATRWRCELEPIFAAAWPLDAALRDEQTSKAFAWTALSCGEAFDEAVATISDVLTPIKMRSIGTWLLHQEQAKSIPQDHPQSFVRLLDRCIAADPPLIPDDLGEVLDGCVTVDPDVQHTREYIRLNALRRKLTS